MKQYDVILTCNYSPWSNYSGGGQKSTHMVATELCNQGNSVCVVYSKGPFEKVEVPDVPYDIKWAFFFAIKPGISSIFRFLNGISFYRIIKKISTSTTVIHSNGDEGSLLGYIANKQKFVYTNRYPNFDTYMFGNDWRKASTWVKITLRERRFTAMALGLFKADVITCTSKHSIDQIHNCFNIPKENLHLVFNGLDPVFMNQSLPNFDTQSGILFYGRLTKSKGIDVLVKAYKQLSHEIQQKHPLTIIGQGPLKNDIEKEAAHFPITIIEWSFGQELVDTIKKASLVVLPSLEESFGNTMLETLALGQRLITTNKGSLPEVLGKWGTQIDSITTVSIAQAISTQLDEVPNTQKQEMQSNDIQSQYSWETTTMGFKELYK
ncbi:MAG: glycosyltransferase family 4 protein [Fibrobacterales bacterium]